MSASRYTYEGELSDPEQGSITSSVYRCDECACLVTYNNQSRHSEWHADLVYKVAGLPML